VNEPVIGAYYTDKVPSLGPTLNRSLRDRNNALVLVFFFVCVFGTSSFLNLFLNSLGIHSAIPLRGCQIFGMQHWSALEYLITSCGLVYHENPMQF